MKIFGKNIKNDKILSSRKKTLSDPRVILNLSAKDYREDFIIIATELMEESAGSISKFIINDSNKEVINQYYYYLTGDNRFKGDLNKGIMLIGPYGTGKTTLIKIISQLIFKHSNKVFHFTSCVNLPDNIKHHGLEYYVRRPLILDEIGRESKVVKDYGTERRLFPEILSLRYNTRAWTFGTSNYNFEDLGEMYGGYIKDRMQEMFNFIELNGKSFRL